TSSATSPALFCSVIDISCSDIFTYRSEVVAKRKLNLAIGSQAHGSFDRLPQQAKRSARGRLSKRSARLQARRNHTRGIDRRQCIVQRRGGHGELGAVEDVEDLRAEFNVRPFGDSPREQLLLE